MKTPPEIMIFSNRQELSTAVSAHLAYLAKQSCYPCCPGRLRHEEFLAEGIRARVVSMPSWELFERQDQSYRDAVIPPVLKARLAVEQASTVGWHRYVGSNGHIIGMHTFGASAPLKALQEKFGFTAERIVAAAKDLVARNTG